MVVVIRFLPALWAKKSGAVVKPNLLCWNWLVLLLGLLATLLPNSDMFPTILKFELSEQWGLILDEPPTTVAHVSLGETSSPQSPI